MSSDPPIRYEQILSVKTAHEADLMQKAHVVGVGVGMRQRGGALTEEIALIVMVNRKRPLDELAEQDQVPAEIDGVPVDIQEIGQPTAQ